MDRVIKKIPAIVSLFSTPTILFISTSSRLYLKNQDVLDYHNEVLTPYLTLFGVTIGIGVIFYAFRSMKIFKVGLWLYYLISPFFMFYLVIRTWNFNFIDDPIFLLLSITVLTIIAFQLSRISNSIRVKNYFAILGALLLLVEVVNYFSSIEGIQTGKVEVNYEDAALANGKTLPNIYQIIFDEFQTDMFQLTLSPEIEKKLGGFIFFPENITNYGRTGMSLASIFTGLMYDYETPQIDYLVSAFSSERSIISSLDSEGYEMLIYYTKFLDINYDLFDFNVQHKDNLDVDLLVNLQDVFWKLWIYSYTPNSIAAKLISPDEFIQIENHNFIPKDTPIVSYLSFRNYLETEALLPSSNRFTFIHLIIPHFPNVLESDCTYDRGDISETTPIEQSNCATKLMIEFVDLLKDLNRFDQSLIIIQSDHGSSYSVINGEITNTVGEGFNSLAWNKARARSLLLIKPPGMNSNEPFLRSGFESMLIDIPPTIYDAIDLNYPWEFDGISLLDHNTYKQQRRRYYHFFNKLGANESTDEMRRYIFVNGEISFDQTIPLTKNE